MQCETCVKGMYITNGLCADCHDTNCNICGEDGLCKDCKKNYRLLEDKTCTEDICDIEGCSKCVEGDNTKCAKCTFGHMLSADEICDECSGSDCKNCAYDEDGNEMCTSCKFGYIGIFKDC